MGGLYLPPEVRAELENEAAVERQVHTLREVDAALKRHDRNLSLVFVKPGVPEWDLPPGAVPARFHVQVRSDGVPVYYHPIQGPNGEFREPTIEGTLAMMRERDLHDPQVMRAAVERDRRRRAREARDAELESEQRRDEMRDDFRAARRVPGEPDQGGFQRRKWGR